MSALLPVPLVRRMNTEAMQGGAKIDQSRTVQAQPHDRCALGGRNAENLCCVLAPCKMIRPPLLAGMEQRRFPFCHRVHSGLISALETVAAQAREREVRLVCGTAFRFRRNVLYRKRIGIKSA